MRIVGFGSSGDIEDRAASMHEPAGAGVISRSLTLFGLSDRQFGRSMSHGRLIAPPLLQSDPTPYDYLDNPPQT